MRVPGVRRRPEGRFPPSVRSDPSCTKRRFQEEDDGPAMKLYMSEDAVSACLQRLSLENDHNYGGNGLPKTSPPPEPQDTGRGSSDSDSDDEKVLVDSGDFCMSSCNVISVCPNLEEKLREPRPESIVPKSLLHPVMSPCLELVLWSPPSGPIHQLLSSLAGVKEGERKPTPWKKEADEGMEL
ncbi:uncharacterized protein RB166_007110 [Leptodactylus fuscus]